MPVHPNLTAKADNNKDCLERIAVDEPGPCGYRDRKYGYKPLCFLWKMIASPDLGCC